MGSIVAEIAEKLSATAAGTSQTGTLTIGEGDLVLGSTAVTSTAAELNIMDGVTATAASINSVQPSHHKLPSLSTANRPGEGGGTNASVTAVVGMLIYNTTLGILQQYNVNGWASIDSPPTITSFTYPSGTTALDPAGVIVLTGSTTANGDATVTVSSTTGITPGMTITGTGIPSSTTIISITDGTHFELSANATATGSANVTLTINSATLVITGTNFQTGVTVLIDGTAPTTVTRNSATQVTVTGPPAKSAQTFTNGLVITNPTGLAASADIVYDAIPAWTTSAGSLGTFVDGAFTNSSTPTIRIVAAEASDTIDYAQTNSAGVVNTDGVAGLVLGTTGANAGYLTGTLNGTDGATNNFYAKPTDDEGQIGAVRLFSIISKDYSASGGTVSTPSGYRVHTFQLSQTGTAFIANEALTIDFLVIAGGGGGSQGGGGAGGYIYTTSSALSAGSYTITVGDGGVGHSTGNGLGNQGLNSVFNSNTAVGGGYGSNTSTGGSGGSGGGGQRDGSTGGTGTAGPPRQGYDGGVGTAGGWSGAGSGGGAGSIGVASQTNGSSGGEKGGDGGIGLAFTITGASVMYAGGGGGGTEGTGGFGAGGSGIGGRGYSNSDSQQATDGAEHTGSGGGGRQVTSGSGTAGEGGSGIVIIRYAV